MWGPCAATSSVNVSNVGSAGPEYPMRAKYGAGNRISKLRYRFVS
jgi:hypothetical protein